jgi:Holliday junction resolvase RusA-like endonuclease
MPRTQTFLMERKPSSHNEIFRKHYRTVQKICDAWKQEAFYAVAFHKIKVVGSYPVHLTFHGLWRTKARRDADNIYVKPVIDQLVSIGILKDDDIAHVASVTLSGEVGYKEDGLQVTITEP